MSAFPAEYEVNTPNGPVNCCRTHAMILRDVMSTMGVTVSMRYAEDATTCSNCENEAKLPKEPEVKELYPESIVGPRQESPQLERHEWQRLDLEPVCTPLTNDVPTQRKAEEQRRAVVIGYVIADESRTQYRTILSGRPPADRLRLGWTPDVKEALTLSRADDARAWVAGDSGAYIYVPVTEQRE